MKLAIGVFAIVWLLCGLAGASLYEDLDTPKWEAIAWGPITLVKALNENPVNIPDNPA